MMPELKISSLQDGKRLDVVLARTYPEFSRAFLQKWIKEGRVTRAGKEVSPSYHVQAGEIIKVAQFEPVGGFRAFSSVAGEGKARSEEGHPSPSVLFEDASILVLNKPAGLVVHPAPSHKGWTLVDWLAGYLGPKVTGLFKESSRLGVVHRLDKDTTGVLLVAKTVQAQNHLGKQFQDRKVKKTYAAFVEGLIKTKMGVISAPVGRSHQVPSRMAVSSTGRPSETTFEVVKVFKEVSQLNLHPKTGRTHQIRVHCAAIGHPIVGDVTYGSADRWAKVFAISRPLLHAERLELEHPTTHKKISFEAPWPADMKQALSLFRRSMTMALVALMVSMVGRTCHADEDAQVTRATKTSQGIQKAVAAAKAATQEAHELKKEMESIQAQFKSLIEEVSALQDRATSIQSSLDEVDAGRRLRDLEKAISDLNGKSVANSTAGDETKTQLMDLTHKLKAQQDALDQLRDQVDRLNRALIETKAHEDAAPEAPPAASVK